MDLGRLRVAVIGAGIGGLAVARALAVAGAQVTVLEQAAEIAEIGAGLQVSPNGFAVLRALGVGLDVAGGAIRAETVSLRDYRAGEILSLDLKGLEQRDYYFVHRADLIRILADAARAAEVQIRLLQQVQEVVDGPRPLIRLRTGAEMEADLVIGADGLHSVLRKTLCGDETPRFTGQVAWRAVVLNTERRGAQAQVHMGPGRHVVTYPLRDGTMLNIVAVREQKEWVEESWSRRDDPANLRAAFDDFGPDVKTILARVADVRQWGLFRHPVAHSWHGTSTALLGDAAHPTLPFMAQGASMALEDAWALVRSLLAADTMGVGLAAYQAVRQDRARRVIDTASGNAWKYHLSFPPLRMAAHGALRVGGFLAPERMLRQFRWIYDYDITTKV